jgi:hypothetical protein
MVLTNLLINDFKKWFPQLNYQQINWDDFFVTKKKSKLLAKKDGKWGNQVFLPNFHMFTNFSFSNSPSNSSNPFFKFTFISINSIKLERDN